jgi:AcrR family transcriptional regulator
MNAGTASSPSLPRSGCATTSLGRGRPRSSEADQAIEASTLALLEEEGFSSLTMAGVASRAGVSTATLYRRWPSKLDLVVGVLAKLSEDAPIIDTGCLAGDLTSWLTNTATKLAGDGGRLFEGLVGDGLRHPALSDALRVRLLAPRRAELAAMLDRAVARGEIPQPEDASVTISLITGALYERRLISGEPLTPGVVRSLVTLLLRALGCAT